MQASCDPGRLVASGPIYYTYTGQQITELVFLSGGSDLSSTGYSETSSMDLVTTVPDTTESNCRVEAAVNVPGVGMNRDIDGWPAFSCSTDADCAINTTHQCTFDGVQYACTVAFCSSDADCVGWGIGKCTYPGPTTGVCDVAPVPGSFGFGSPEAVSGSPEILAARGNGWLGDLDYRIYIGVTTSSLATVSSFPKVGTLVIRSYQSDTPIDCRNLQGCKLLSSVPVYLEDVAVIASLPVLFN